MPRRGQHWAWAGGLAASIRTVIQTAVSGARFSQRAGLDVLTWPAFDGYPVSAVVTTRHGGVSTGGYTSLNLSLAVGDDPGAVAENRSRAAAAVGGTLDDMVFAEQVHSRNAQIVTAADRGRGARDRGSAIPATDALVTSDVGTVMAALAADCVPIVLYDPVCHMLACVHAGWRGMVARVVEPALAAMATLGTRAADVIAALGPAISPEVYQVGGEVAAEVRQAFGDGAESLLVADGTGRWLLDIWGGNRLALAAAGVPATQIHVAQVPTGPAPGHFFSYRAEHPCGRFAAVARLMPRESA